MLDYEDVVSKVWPASNDCFLLELAFIISLSCTGKDTTSESLLAGFALC